MATPVPSFSDAWLTPPGCQPNVIPSADWVQAWADQASHYDRAHLARLAHWQGSAVSNWIVNQGLLTVTGQQPAFGGGPLYSLAKTAHAIAVANQLSSPTRPVLPCFWCASDDHDFGEADHVDIIDDHGQLHRIRSEFSGPRRALRHVAAAPDFDHLINALHTHVGPGLGAEWLRDQAPMSGETYGAWTNRLISALFSPHTLLTVEAYQLRPLWKNADIQALNHWPLHELTERRNQLLAQHQADAFGPLETAPLFIDHPEGRTASDNRAELLAASQAGLLSPGAALRPMYQQLALPAVVAILGPGERAYHQFIGPLYDVFNAPRPQILARHQAFLAPGWWRRGCAAWHVAPSDVPNFTSTQTTEATATLAPLTDALHHLRTTQVVAPLQPGLQASLARLQREHDRLQQALDRHQHQVSGRPAIGRLQAWMHPRGKPQDRTLSVAQAIWMAGPGLGTALVEAYQHQALATIDC